MKDWKKYGQNLLVLVVISVFLAITGPYNATAQFSFPVAVAYWFILVLCGGLSANRAMLAYVSLRPDAPIYLQLLVGAFVAAISVTALLLLADLIWGDGGSWYEWLWLYGLVLVIALAVTFVIYLVQQAFSSEVSPAGEASAPIARFLQRLPRKYHAATLYAVSSEDHYLRVHTNLGETLILMRLADAVRELAGSDGLQVHRSWWIARAGIADETRENGRPVLILASGVSVPVSRSFVAAVRAAGLLS